MIKTARNILELESKALLESSKNLDSIEFEKIINAILESSKLGGKLIVCGVGKSGHIGAKISATLSSTGTPSFFLHPTEAMHGDLGAIGKNDLILAISYSGESSEILAIMPHLKRLSSGVITMSKDKNSPLSKLGDFFLKIDIDKEACPIGCAPMSSTTLTLALGDALAGALMKARNFNKLDFGNFHPGGSLGKRLFVKIEDLMQKENLPLINEKTTLREAIVEMSEKRLGNALIVKDNKVLAILSDGDLRRALMMKDFNLDDLAINYATLNPKVCDNKEALASEILAFIEENKIQLLAIVDKDKNLLGVVHIHTLISAGIKS